MPHEFAQMTAAELKALPPSQTVFFFPVGPLEDHGPHLPMNLDLVEAEELCQQAALRLEREMAGWYGVIMPAAPLGIESNTSTLRITVRAHVLRDWLVDACKGLNKAGYRQFVCFSGHLGPKQLTAIEEAGRILARFTPIWLRGKQGPVLVSASSGLVGWKDVKQAPFWLDAGEHGGARDTSVALHLVKRRNIQVKPDYTSLPSEVRRGNFLSRMTEHVRGTRSGYWGKPAAADASVGERLLVGSLDQIFPKLRAVWEGTNPQALFRSWYSILPIHKSFFKAYLIAGAFFGLFCLWIYFNLKALVSG